MVAVAVVVAHLLPCFYVVTRVFYSLCFKVLLAVPGSCLGVRVVFRALVASVFFRVFLECCYMVPGES